jgi:hypothetical protein
MLTKPKCFSDNQWRLYQTEIQAIKNGKPLDICFDCTVDYQSRMRKEGRCEFPLKRLDKIAEYAA